MTFAQMICGLIMISLQVAWAVAAFIHIVRWIKGDVRHLGDMGPATSMLMYVNLGTDLARWSGMHL